MATVPFPNILAGIICLNLAYSIHSSNIVYDDVNLLTSLIALNPEKIIVHCNSDTQEKTIQVLHRNLARNLEEATAWAWAFNLYAAKTFTKEEFVEAFYAYVQTNGGKYARSAMEKEFDCFKNTYVSDKAFDLNRILDEDTMPFFAPLKLLEYSGNGHFEKRRIDPKDVPAKLLFYCILKDNEEHLLSNTQINVDTLFEGNNQVGKYMNLSYSTLLEMLQQLENRKWISLVNNFGNRYTEVRSTDATELLTDYYREIEG